MINFVFNAFTTVIGTILIFSVTSDWLTTFIGVVLLTISTEEAR
ncbi:hypothetical protein [Alkalihalobacillus pseudalcaliphilus]|nr:hypothetical protein [Alkalihalobacillus pseudalcaliphilus]